MHATHRPDWLTVSASQDRAEYDRIRYEKTHAELIAAVGDSCVECGSTESLELDHIDPSTKEFAITSRWTRGVEALRSELAKCQLLCADCHKAKSIASRSVEHGGGASGKRNCKCGPCRERKSAYMRAYQAARTKAS